MRYPKDFGNWEGNRRFLIGYPVCIIQWNVGKNKNFAAEVLGQNVHRANYFSIPGKGDEAMQNAIEMAFQLRNEIKEGKRWQR